jgi:O-acetyl-ADP-ribose deacetylase (regulator of RNase III)
MIRVLVGDLFESNAQTLVNTVNCVGVMGKGVALGFKERFPEMYQDYEVRCKRKEVRLGRPYLYRQLFPPNIVNFPTKDHWRSVSRLSDIVAGLEYLERHYREWGITSLAVPPLGCGQGQLDWHVVGPTLFRHLSNLDIPVEMYAPLGTPREELDVRFLSQGERSQTGAVIVPSNQPEYISPASVALVEIIARMVRELHHWPIGRVRFHKLAYFATQSGLPTGLRFVRGSYGPFSSDVTRLLTRLVNNGLLVEERFGRMLTLRPGPTYHDAIERPVYSSALAPWETTMERIADLLLRLSTDDAELAATVHFVWRSLSSDATATVSEDEIVEEVKRWKQKRRPPFEDAAIRQTVRNLVLLEWIDVALDSAEMDADEELLVRV